MTDSVETCGPLKILLDHYALARRMVAREEEGLGEVLDLRHALHAPAPAAIHRLDDEVAPALDGDALQFLRRRDLREPRHGDARGREPLLHRELVAGDARALERNSGQVEAVGDGRGCHRRVGGDADHAVDLADLAAVARGGGGRLIRTVDVGDDARIGVGEAGRRRVAVGDDDVKPHLLGTARGIRRFDSAGDDEDGLVHQK